MRIGILMVAIMASMLLTLSAHAASDPDSAKLLKSTSDHTKFKALQQEFNSGPEVTKACLTCHTEAAKLLRPDLNVYFLDAKVSYGGDGTFRIIL